MTFDLSSLIMSTKATQTENFTQRWKFCNGKNLFQLISTLLLPLMLGIFTIVVTFSQQNSSAQQRAEDRLAAEQLRELERNLADERYQNELLDDFLEDFSQFLTENKGSLTDKPLQATLARVRTLNILRQLTSQRNLRIIRFLFEVGLFKRNASLDLSLAELRQIDFRDLAIDRRFIHGVSFAGILLTDSTLNDLEMKDVDLKSMRFDRTDFSFSSFENVDLSSTNFNRTKFTSTRFHHVDFTATKLNQIDLSFAFFDDVDFTDAEFRNVVCRSCQFFNVRFTSAKFQSIDLSFSTLKNVNFSSGQLFNVNLAFVKMQNVEFLSSKLKKVEFTSAPLDHRYSHSINFESSHLNEVNFAFTKFSNVSFRSTQQYFVNFSSSILVAADFSYITIQGADRYQSSCRMENSQQNHLSYVSFRQANLQGVNFQNAYLIMADFVMANLQECDFDHAQISDDQLRSAASIHRAQLPSESQIQQTNLIRNGDADCNISPNVFWTIPNNDIEVIRFENKSNNCYFAVAKTSGKTSAMMWQRVYLPMPSLIVVFNVKINSNVMIQIIGISNEGNVVMMKNFTTENTNMIVYLHPDVRIIETIVHFDQYGSMDNIELYLDDEKNYPEPFRIPIISSNAQWNSEGEWIVKNGIDNPQGIYVDIDRTVYIAASTENRIFMWKEYATTGEVVAGDTTGGSRLNQLLYPTDVIRDHATMSLLVSDTGNRRVMRWVGRYSELFIEDIDCNGLAMDDQQAIYVVDYILHEVRRYVAGKKEYTIIAGGHGGGSAWNQLLRPSYLFVDDEYSIYVSDSGNHQVMKWMKGAQQGMIVAGGHCLGHDLSQLRFPQGISVDSSGTVYIADSMNHRIMRWRKNDEEGTVITNMLTVKNQSRISHVPVGLFIDQYDQMYVGMNTEHSIRRYLLMN